MQTIGMIASLGSLIFWIMTLIHMFKKAGALQGILGIICGLWAFIWGWLNVGETNQKGVMMAWTVCILIGVVAQSMAMSAS